ncbi:hypothetical protein FB561_4996 [Kribbella amoyensis]|uniref:Peptidase inhibitor family I36 n=1 Tax=Kribbella amoyensis TaxID=996641 RepID=A0A561BY86_9ACTN|nr:hypothetical protein [Kribbella amoyensis]TWD83827.1 hypothetical protein FB561_4996 [Kribbella amoyensis]
MRKYVRLAASFVGAVGASAAVLTPINATAGVTAYDCPADALGCLYDYANGTGDRYVVRSYGEYDLPYGWKDRVSSVVSLKGNLTLWNWNATYRRYDRIYYLGRWDYPGAVNTADRIRVLRY